MSQLCVVLFVFVFVICLFVCLLLFVVVVVDFCCFLVWGEGNNNRYINK